LLAGFSDRQNLLARQEGALALSRRMGEGAVMADIAAELRQRDKDFSRIGDLVAMGKVTPRRGGVEQGRQVIHIDEAEGLVARQPAIMGKVGEKLLDAHGKTASLKEPATAGTGVPRSWRMRARVRGAALLPAAMKRSAATSMSWPAPSSRRICGVRPSACAAATWRAKLSGPKAGGIRSGGAIASMLVPPSRVAGTTTIGLRRVASSTASN